MKKQAFFNLVTTILYEIFAILSGVIIPRIILVNFGSEANGLVSSLNQFLNYISLIEGGLGSVILSSLYKPLVEKDNYKLSRVVNASNSFFRKISYILIAYTLLVATIYPLVVTSKFSYFYIASLAIILSISLFIQYCYAISYRLLLQADTKYYIVQIVQVIMISINVVLCLVEVYVYPNLHIMKICSSIVFALQPIVFNKYVSKYYKIDKTLGNDEKALSQRWDGFSQNFAWFINSNVDVTLLSLFGNLSLVSVYAVYNTIAEGIKLLIMSLSKVFTPLIGKEIARGNNESANKYLDLYELCIYDVSAIIFGCCICLLPNFVIFYTKGVNDVDYYRFYFSVFLIITKIIYCIRDPYVTVAYSAGRFRDTAKGPIFEAIINIVVSILLVKKYDLIGVIIGTVAGMLFRLFYQIVYLKSEVIDRPVVKSIKKIISLIIVITLGTKTYFLLGINISTIYEWIVSGFICFGIFSLLQILINIIIDREVLIGIVKQVKKK